MEKITLTTTSSKEYELLDSGREEKLERYGAVILSRPDPQALWEKQLQSEWAKADALYVRNNKEGEWRSKKELPKEWPIEAGGINMLIRPTSFKHTGLFPEQIPNWQWLEKIITHALKEEGRETISVLNLFGYTGGATLVAAKAGADVCHVDASKTAVAWARENAALSGLSEKPVRWIVEDALAFARRELKRGKRYDIILMDPPAFGHGPEGEVWKFDEQFLELMALCKELLSEKPLAFLINGYAAGYSSLAFAYNLSFLEEKFGGLLQYGELTIEESKEKRLLPCGIFARWQKNP